MATQPPYYSPRDARRQAKAQERLQRSQYRLQNAFLRRRPSFVGPLLLITTGVVALLLETGKLHASAFWPWYARWWPLLLILIGLGLLFEYFLDRDNPQGGRRSIGGIVWLIVLLSLAGYGSRAAVHAGALGDQLGEVFGGFGDHDGDWMSMMGEEHTGTQTLVQPISASGSLSIINARGDVQVSAADAGAASEVRVEAREVVHANSDQAAQGDLDAIRPTLTAQGANVTLSTPSRQGGSVDLKVTVPAGIALVVQTAHGDVLVSGVRREVHIKASHGNVTLDNLGASATLEMDHGDVQAHGIAGDLNVSGRAGDVSATDVKGKSLLNGEFFGDTRLSRIGSAVHFHSSRTDLDVPKLAGELTLDSGDLRLSGPSGGIRLTTRAKDVEITDLVGDAHVEDSDGDVNLSSAMPLGNLQLTDRTGSMIVTVPGNASFTVHGSAHESDELTTDFPLSNVTSGDRKLLSGQVGQGGPHLELETTHGDLTLRRGGNQAAAPVVPAVPEIPGAPERPARSPSPPRHLHASGEEPQPTVQ